MGRIVVSEFVTLDGVVEDPGGSEKSAAGGWAFKFDRGPDGDKFKLDELMAADGLLLGRVTYDGFAEAWPERTEGEFAEKMNGMPKYVVSSTLENPAWNNTTVLSGDPVAAVSKQRDESGELLVAGSARLVQLLIENDLVDELRLMVYPTIIGSGKRLFADSAHQTALQLVEAKPSADTVLLTYRRAGA